MSVSESSTSSSQALPARAFPSRETASDSKGSRDSCSSSSAPSASSSQLQMELPLDTSCGRTYQAALAAVPGARRARISDACSESWMSAGTVWRGDVWTANLPEYMTGRAVDSEGRLRNAAGVSTLWEVLDATAPRKYSLSVLACEGIIRRVEKHGRNLPKMLTDALQSVIRKS